MVEEDEPPKNMILHTQEAAKKRYPQFQIHDFDERNFSMFHKSSVEIQSVLNILWTFKNELNYEWTEALPANILDQIPTELHYHFQPYINDNSNWLIAWRIGFEYE